HLGEFGTKELIAVAKGELVEALPAEGTAVLNADDPLVAAMASRTSARTLTFGYAETADVRIEAVELDDLGRPHFDLVYQRTPNPVALKGIGTHQAANAAAAASAAIALGLPIAEVTSALSLARSASPWRLEVHDRADGLTVVNDAYNANPDSMRAALETLAGISGRTGRRAVAVLGEMRELGEASDQEHAEVGILAHRLALDLVVVIGEGARPTYDALVQQRGEDGTVRHVDTAEQAVDWLNDNVAGSDVVLVKASRAAQLEQVAQALLGPVDIAGADDEEDR
ncbi:MAG: UDP-N-acetylmuramoyl-tripeptide--D-alanyl-D-alanine ligase, partial [Actinomycetota bacterium]|nr:UDP-N-acetylmuramoyl-tripeptide--D-alanyl-D-alanine ligase [Actinomycetota bacterium]